jgi:hypothetical protein
VAERLVAAAQVAILTDQAPIARTLLDRDVTLLAALVGMSTRSGPTVMA